MNAKIFDTNLARKNSFQVVCTGLAGENDSVEIIENLDGTPAFDGTDLTDGIMEILKSDENFGQGTSIVHDQIVSYIVKNHYMPKFQKIAQEKNYKSGWVFYHIKEKFGYNVATEVCEK